MTTNSKIACLFFLSGLLIACNNFLDTYPYDELDPSFFWKTEKDANDAVIGCYDGWVNGYQILYWDCTSDIGFSFHEHEGYNAIGNGSLSPTSDNLQGFYSYTTIRRCNTFLEKAKDISFSKEEDKKDLFAQVYVMRAYRYFLMNFWYGGVPITEQLFEHSTEAQLPPNSEEEVKQYIYKDLDQAIADLDPKPKPLGRITKGTARALKMRVALYFGDYQMALNEAKAIKDMQLYSLEPDYADLFTLAGQKSKEIIYSAQYLQTVYTFWLIGAMYNNADGGWSSLVPTQNLVDMYEMSNGLTIDEHGSTYDFTHPFYGRDPRMAKTILYPGQNWKFQQKPDTIINTLDKEINGKKNANYYVAENNASKTGLSWAKYTTPSAQYTDVWNTSVCPIMFRYAEVLLTIAEINVELNQNFSEVYETLNAIRTRAGMPVVDETKYNTQEKLRELVRRERCVELAGEGFRRADILRWKDNEGNMVAEKVLNGRLLRIMGTVSFDKNIPEGKRASIITPTEDNLMARTVEERKFLKHHRYLPFPQEEIDKNKQLIQNSGY